MYKKVLKTRTVYVCKEGWAPTGSGCTKRKFNPLVVNQNVTHFNGFNA